MLHENPSVNISFKPFPSDNTQRTSSFSFICMGFYNYKRAARIVSLNRNGSDNNLYFSPHLGDCTSEFRDGDLSVVTWRPSRFERQL